jgi:hypothetical protein
MTERTVIRDSRVDQRSEMTESSEDNISVASTIEPDDMQYYVDRILGELHEDGRTYYMLKWTGYDYLHSSWEPAENVTQTTIDDWQDEKKRIASGLSIPFDTDELEEKIAAWKRTRRRRRQMRKQSTKNPDMPIASPQASQESGEGSGIHDTDDSSDEAVESPGEIEDAMWIDKSPKRTSQNRRMSSGARSRGHDSTKEGQQISKGEAPRRDLGATELRMKDKGNQKRTRGNIQNTSRHREASPLASSESDVEFSSSTSKLQNFGRAQKRSSGYLDLVSPTDPQRGSGLSHPLASERLNGRSLGAITSGTTGYKGTARPSTTRLATAATRGGANSSRRGLTSSRGTSRGGYSGPPSRSTNVFASLKPARKKRDLLREAADPNKPSQLAPNFSTLRKLELLGRAQADREPDIDIIGGLIDPTKGPPRRYSRPSLSAQTTASVGAKENGQEFPASTPQKKGVRFAVENNDDVHRRTADKGDSPGIEPAVNDRAKVERQMLEVQGKAEKTNQEMAARSQTNPPSSNNGTTPHVSIPS